MKRNTFVRCVGLILVGRGGRESILGGLVGVGILGATVHMWDLKAMG